MNLDLTPVETLLRARIGLDPASSGPGLLTRAIRARMKALAIPSVQSERYVALLNESNAEFEALVDEVVVPESWFFRDVHPFVMLTETVADRWRIDRNRPPLRALSLPCARGEEPYSIAIALLDGGLSSRQLRIDAVDISRPILESAKLALYRENAFRTRELTFRARHFDMTDDGYQLRGDVKRTVHFHHGNLLDPRLLSSQPPYDVIFCRNLLIYFDDPARALAQANLDRLLGPDGVLFIGHAEQPGPRFRTVGNRNCFAYERIGKAQTAGEPILSGVPKFRPASRKPSIKTTTRQPDETPAKASAKSEIKPTLLGEAVRLADEGRHAEALAVCEKQIQTRGPSASALYLLGVIRHARGESGEAFRCFEKAVYLDPRHEDALLNLALIARSRGDLAGAAKYERRAERAFQEKPTP